MIDPDQRERHLEPVDIQVKQRTTVQTVIIAIGVIVGMAVIAEIIVRIVTALRDMQ